MLSKHWKKIVAISVLLLILFTCLIAGLTYYLYQRSKNSPDRVVLENLDPKTVEEIKTNLVYDPTAATSDYYSPKLDVVITYPNATFSLSEGYDGVNVSTKTSLGESFLYANLGTSKFEPTSGVVSKYDYADEFKIGEETEKDGVNVVTFTYEVQSYLDKSEVNEYFHSLYILKLENNYYYIDVKEVNSNKGIEKYEKEYIALLKNISTDTSKLDPVIDVALVNGEMTMNFKRGTWSVSSQTNNYLGLNYIEDKTGYLSFSVSAYKNEYGTYSAAEIRESLQNDLKSSRKFNREYSFSLEKPIQEEKFEDITLYTYSYSYQLGSIKYTTVKYKGYDADSKILVDITINDSLSDPSTQAEIESLINSIRFPESAGGSETSYVPNDIIASSGTTGSVLGTTSIEVEKASVLGKPAVVHIFSRTCLDVTVDPAVQKETTIRLKSSYNVCSAGLGTGFFVNSEGYIATNAHVAASNPTDVLLGGSYDPDDFYTDIIRVILEFEPGLNPSDPDDQQQIIYMVYLVVLELQDQELISLDNVTYESYIQSDKPFEISQADLSLINTADHLEASLVDYNQISSSYGSALSKNAEEITVADEPDLALLKVENVNGIEYPAVKLADHKKINPGSKILVIGFPGAADNDELFAASASQIPTITSGTISAIKPNPKGTFNLMQIDASISHGNSGGPIIGSDGEVYGVATYGITFAESGDYNAGVSVEEVTKMLSDNNVSNETGNVSEYISSGINNLANNYYNWAIRDFQEAKKLYPSSADVLDPLIIAAQEKIDAGEDNSPVFTIGDIYIHQNEVYIIGAVICVFLVIVFVNFILFLFFLFRRGKNKHNVPPQQSFGGGNMQGNHPPFNPSGQGSGVMPPYAQQQVADQ